MMQPEPPDRSQPVSWHASSLDDVLAATGSRVAGLRQIEAEERLAADGPPAAHAAVGIASASVAAIVGQGLRMTGRSWRAPLRRRP